VVIRGAAFKKHSPLRMDEWREGRPLEFH
jgi:hypothetical protein